MGNRREASYWSTCGRPWLSLVGGRVLETQGSTGNIKKVQSVQIVGKWYLVVQGWQRVLSGPRVRYIAMKIIPVLQTIKSGIHNFCGIFLLLQIFFQIFIFKHEILSILENFICPFCKYYKLFKYYENIM